MNLSAIISKEHSAIHEVEENSHVSLYEMRIFTSGLNAPRDLGLRLQLLTGLT
jgi:hypothetical protein